MLKKMEGQRGAQGWPPGTQSPNAWTLGPESGSWGFPVYTVRELSSFSKINLDPRLTEPCKKTSPNKQRAKVGMASGVTFQLKEVN